METFPRKACVCCLKTDKQLNDAYYNSETCCLVPLVEELTKLFPDIQVTEADASMILFCSDCFKELIACCNFRTKLTKSMSWYKTVLNNAENATRVQVKQEPMDATFDLDCVKKEDVETDSVTLPRIDDVRSLAEEQTQDMASTSKMTNVDQVFLVVEPNVRNNPGTAQFSTAQLPFVDAAMTNTPTTISNKRKRAYVLNQPNSGILHGYIARNHQCRICSFFLKDAKALNVHEKTHLNAPCPYCNKQFFTVDKMAFHARIHKSGKPSICPFCGQSFHLYEDLLTHTYHVHNEIENKFKCFFCTKVFVYRRNLLEHEYTSHKKRQKYECLWCNKRYTREDDMQMHRKRCPNKSIALGDIELD